VPEEPKNLIGVPEASYVRPLIFGLPGPSTNLQLLVEFPSQLAVSLQKRTADLRCAFLSPVDYARHGGDYLIVPGIAVSSTARSNVIKLYVNPKVRNIDTLAVDIRVTSEIILAKILLSEKFPNLASDTHQLQIIPMLPDLQQMLRKADAALIVNFSPQKGKSEDIFCLDLVEEWSDLTGLPYVHGMWVAHDDADMEKVLPELQRASELGRSHLAEIARSLSKKHDLTIESGKEYLASFHYDLGEREQEGLSQFIRYAYYHVVLPDVPDLNFFELPPTPPPGAN
jgi:chorismate dehydratase